VISGSLLLTGTIVGEAFARQAIRCRSGRERVQEADHGLRPVSDFMAIFAVEFGANLCPWQQCLNRS